MDNKKARTGCIGDNYYDYNREYFPRTGKYPLLEKYGNALGEEFAAYVHTLSLKGYTDDRIAVSLGVRWSYLFRGLTFFDWSQLLSQFREYENQGSASLLQKKEG